MKFTKVDEVPRMGYKRNELKVRLEEFMSMHAKAVEVEWRGTYNSAAGAAGSLYRCAQRWAFPIEVCRRGETVYMIRRDL